jgi:hypothetical protein
MLTTKGKMKAQEKEKEKESKLELWKERGQLYTFDRFFCYSGAGDGCEVSPFARRTGVAS